MSSHWAVPNKCLACLASPLGDLNPHALWATDFKSGLSTDSSKRGDASLFSLPRPCHDEGRKRTLTVTSCWEQCACWGEKREIVVAWRPARRMAFAGAQTARPLRSDIFAQRPHQIGAFGQPRVQIQRLSQHRLRGGAPAHPDQC